MNAVLCVAAFVDDFGNVIVPAYDLSYGAFVARYYFTFGRF